MEHLKIPQENVMLKEIQKHVDQKYLLESRGIFEVEPSNRTIDLNRIFGYSEWIDFCNTRVNHSHMSEKLRKLCDKETQVAVQKFKIEIGLIAGTATPKEIMESVNDPFMELWQLAILVTKCPSLLDGKVILFVKDEDGRAYLVTITHREAGPYSGFSGMIWDVRTDEHSYLNEPNTYSLDKVFFLAQ